MKIFRADLNCIEHVKAVVNLVNQYRKDPMGGQLPAMSSCAAHSLIEGLLNHPTVLVLLAEVSGEFAGMAVCFQGFSTFEARPLINIHDLIVEKDFRRMGIGAALVGEIADIAKSRNCCRLTLEVRSDNQCAKSLYRSTGFDVCDPPMEFWIWDWREEEKTLSQNT